MKPLSPWISADVAANSRETRSPDFGTPPAPELDQAVRFRTTNQGQIFFAGVGLVDLRAQGKSPFSVPSGPCASKSVPEQSSGTGSKQSL